MRKRSATAPRQQGKTAQQIGSRRSDHHGDRVTIGDVAKAAGVSKATVSRHINHSDLLTPAITARVGQAIRKLGYRPSPMAQALKRGRSRLVGLVVADVANPYSVAVLRGAEQACREAGYLVMLFNIGNDDVREREALAALSSYHVEGFILHTLGRDPTALEGDVTHGKPVVLIDRRLGNTEVDLVGVDNGGAARLGLAHLLDAGYRRIAFVTEPMAGVTSRQERHAAFVQSIAESRGCAGATIELQGEDTAGLAKALSAFFAGGRERRAVMAANAKVTLRVVEALRQLRFALGRNVGLIGFDETDWAPFVDPGITTLAQPTDDIGRCAARCLLERLQGLALPARQILLSATLVPRASTISG